MPYLEFFIPLTILLLIGIVFFFNWQISQKRTLHPAVKNGFLSTTSLDARIITLEQDVDQLSVIVRDMSQLLAQHEERLVEVEQASPPLETNLQEVSLFLRPIKQLENNALFAYETFVELKDEKIHAQEALTLWRIENTLVILSKLMAAAPSLKLICPLPASLLVRDNIIRPILLSLRQYSAILPNFVLMVTGKEQASFTSIEQYNLKKLTDTSLTLGLELKVVDSKILTLERLAHLQTMNFMLINADARQLLYANLHEEIKEAMENADIHFIATQIDDLVDDGLLLNQHIRYGSGVRLGAARPVKTQPPQELLQKSA
jgi:hypothetical protein